MITVGSYEAKTHLPRLLDQVSKGEQVTITKHGVPVAMLVPVSVCGPHIVDEAIESLLELQRGRPPIDPGTIRMMIEEGRK
jgi:prevent-host-death family protein